MRLFKKPLSLLLSLITVLSAFAAHALFRADAAQLIKGTFTVVTFDHYDPGELEYYYSDSWFGTSGKEKNDRLRTMSSALAFTATGISDMPEETFGAILKNIGYSDIETYDMDHTAMDSMGVILARKSIEGKDIVAVVLRGFRYEDEMAANMIAGSGGDIQAFADAEALVESRVSAYIDTHGINAAKYWVSGYSRAGAVANLFGRELNRKLSGFRTAEDDIYVYTFEAPLSSGDDTVYENIHNIIDRRDFITYVYPAAWGLYNNGVPEYFGDTDETITLKTFSLFSENYTQDRGEIKTVDFLEDFIGFLSENLDRRTFCEKLQTPLSNVLEIYYGLNPEQQEAVIDYFKQVIGALKKDITAIPAILRIAVNPTAESSVDAVTNLLIKHMDQVAEKSGNPLSEDDYAVVKSAVRPVVEVMLPIVYADLTATYDPGDGSKPQSAALYHIMTFAGNLETLIHHHLNYAIFSELSALDPNYQKRDNVILGDVDGDGEVTILDATAIQRHLADLDTAVYTEAAADADGDGFVTIIDATAIQRFIAGLPSNENIGKPIEWQPAE